MARKPRSSNEMIAIASMTLEPKEMMAKFGMSEKQIQDAIEAYHSEIDAAFELDKQKRNELWRSFQKIEIGLRQFQERIEKVHVSADDLEEKDYCTLKDGSNEPVRKMGDKSFIIQHLS